MTNCHPHVHTQGIMLPLATLGLLLHATKALLRLPFQMATPNLIRNKSRKPISQFISLEQAETSINKRISYKKREV